uniref:Uncharacterized protein n=1 Tax=Amphimedon queenslandica TaxID=400682 RepID=A0A1X7UF88_AMPQE
MIEELKRMEKERELRRRGKPSLPILSEELRNLLELQFSQVDIPKLYGCSTRTTPK